MSDLAAIHEVQNWMLALPQVSLLTEHILHGGMYCRTVRLKANTVITGALIKVPTILVVCGHAKVLTGEGWTEIHGYNVFAASAPRKQVFVALGDVVITAVFPTKATTVEQAEQEFTDEAELLQSRTIGDNIVTVTGE